MNLNDYFEFLSWTETPNDKYGMTGIAEVLVKGNIPIILRFKQTKSRDGGLFFCAASYSVEENGQKKYINSCELDSRKHHAALVEFMEVSVKSAKKGSQLPPNTSLPHKDYEQQSLFGTASQLQTSQFQEDEKLPF